MERCTKLFSLFYFHRPSSLLFVLLAGLCGLWGGLPSAARADIQGQEPRVFTYTFETLPPSLVLKRGDILRFEGVGPRTGEPQTFAIRAGDEPRVRKTFQDKWQLRYDSQTEHFTVCALAVLQQVNGEWQVRAQTKLRIVNAPPFRIASPTPETRVTEPVSLHVEPSSEDRIDRIGYTLDGKPLGLFASREADALWNPSGIARGTHLLGGVARLTDGSLYTLDAIPVTVIPKLRVLPFAVGENLDLSTLNGRINVRADIDTSLHPRVVTYAVDGKTIAERREAPLAQAAWNPNSLASGTHTLVVDVENETGVHTVSAPLKFAVYRRSGKRASTEEPFVSSRIAMGEEDTAVYTTVESALLARKRVTVAIARLPERLSVAAGTDVVLTGVSEEANDTEVAAYVDGQRQSGFNGKGKFALPVSTQILPPGLHTLKVRQNLTSGATRSVGQSRLLVFEGAPLQLQPLEENTNWFEPVTLRAQIGPGFTPQSILYFVDGHPLPSDPADPQTALFDPRSRQPGHHALWVVGTDAEGVSFKSQPVGVTIPTRVRVPASIAPVVVTKAAHTLPLKATLAPGLAPTQVSFLIDGTPVATQTHAPFDTAVCDVTNLPPGPHVLTVEAHDENDAVYVSAAGRIEVQNAAWAAKRAQEDLQLQRKFKSASAQSGKRIAIALRSPILGAVDDNPIPRDGTIGIARGIAVIFLGKTPVIGRMIPIEANIHPGEGKFTFEATAERDTQNAAKRAFDFARDKAGQGLDWAHTDVLLRHPDNSARTQGRSSGVADAVALVSACLQMPIDHSVVVTGALGANGQIEQVGGLVQKMDAVFNDPTVRAVILPAGSLSESDLAALYYQRPEQMTHRRIIFAHNMEEVLRQTLIGYSDAYDYAEELAQEALAFYRSKDNARALEALRQARELTPENATLSVWMSLMQPKH